MADSSITGLAAASALVGTEPFPIDQSGATVKATANQIKSFVNALPLLIGSQANTTKYPTALEVLSDVTTSDIENHMIGFASERTATFATNGTTPLTGWGIGVYGKGWTNGAARSGGVVGEGMVTLSTDTGSAVGVRGYSSQAHSGGMNIGVYGNATGGLTNFDFYSLNGTIASATGTLTNTGDLATSGKLTVGSGATGFTTAPLGTTYAGLWNTSVVAGTGSYTLLSSNANGTVFLNSAANMFLSIAGSNIIQVASTGAAVTGTMSSTGTITATSGILIGAGASYKDNTGKGIIVAVSPTIASGFGTSPTIASTNTAAFKVTVGTGGAASGVLTFPAASNGWAVHCTDVTSRASIVAVAVSTSTTSVTVEAYSRTTGAASTFAAGDVLEFSALGY
jgi:hypothetical protein